MTFALSNVSGAHFNPSITLGFWLRRVFPGKQLWRYWLVQLVGATLAALVLLALFGRTEDVGATIPADLPWKACAMEVFLTCVRTLVILSVATRHKLLGPTAPLASGGSVALCELFARPISGASENPARSLGPLLVAHRLDVAWIYVVGPAVGAALAVMLMMLVHPHHHDQEEEAARGERGRHPERVPART
jgi:aquaporin NIP